MSYIESVSAKLISRSQVFSKIRLSEFVYTYQHDGTRSSQEVIQLNITDDDLELTWKIKRHYKTLERANDNPYHFSWVWLLQTRGEFFGHLSIARNDEVVFETPFDQSSISTWYNTNDYSIFRLNDRISFRVKLYREHESLSSIMDTYERYFENGSDVDFLVKNEKIPAHRNILSAHSDVFVRMLKDDEVVVDDVDPGTFKSMLRFIYCGNLEPLNQSKLLKLMEVGKRYQLKNLVSFCGNRISNSLTVDNVVDALIVADEVGENLLKKQCEDFIVEYMSEVNKMESFKSLVETNGNLVAEIMQKKPKRWLIKTKFSYFENTLP